MVNTHIDPLRARALKLAVEHIDRHTQEYESSAEQDDVLQHLIDKHQLKIERKRGMWNGKPEDLTVWRYQEIMRQTAANPKYMTPVEGKGARLAQLYFHGSKLLTAYMLEKINHVKQPRGADSEDEEPDDDAEVAETEDGAKESSSASTLAHEAVIATAPSPADAIALSTTLQDSGRKATLPLTRQKSMPATTQSERQQRQAIDMAVSDDAGSSSAAQAGRRLDLRQMSQQPNQLGGSHAHHRSSDQVQGNRGQELKPPTPSPLTPPATLALETNKRKPSVTMDGEIHNETGLKKRRQLPTEIPDSPETNRNGLRDAPQKSQSDGQLTDELHNACTEVVPKPTPTVTLSTASRLLKLSNEEISTSVNALWTELQSFARRFQANTKVDAKARARWLVSPSSELQSIYERLYGSSWKSAALEMNQLDLVKARDVIEGCTAAGVYELVFVKELPWKLPKDTMAFLAEEEAYLEDVLRQSNTHLQLHTLVWQASRNQVLDRDFQQNTVVPIAKELAETFFLIMDSQLSGIGATTMKDNVDPKHFFDQQRKALTSIFTKALILKGLMEVSPDYYKTEFFQSGVGLDREKMEEQHASDERTRQSVAWCVSPLISVQSTKDAVLEVACAAKVFSRPAA